MSRRRRFARAGPASLAGSWRRRLGLFLPLGATLLLAGPPPSAAHEVPAEVTVRMLVWPDGDRLRVLVRVPVEALRDVELPLRGPWLDPAAALPGLRHAARLWIVDYLDVREGGRSLGEPTIGALRVSLPTDRSFAADRKTALAHVTGPPLPAGVELVAGQALLDVLLDYPMDTAEPAVSLVPGLAHLGIRTTTVLRHWTADGRERALQYVGDPGHVRLDPGWHHAAARFLALGFTHILEGIDHLLFLLVLVAPYRRIAPLVPVVTAFTLAHSITLAAAALGFTPTALWFPPLVETLIAASIVWMAVENILGARVGRRWAVAFAFGLVHGFGFSFLLGETLQFAGGQLLAALLAFNVGVELGQLLVLAVAVPALALLTRWIAAVRPGDATRPAGVAAARGGGSDSGQARIPEASTPGLPGATSTRRLTTILVSVILAHSGWHWMTARGADFLQHDLRLPPLDLLFVADLMRWVALALVALAVGHLTGEAFRRLSRRLPSLLEPVPGETS